MEAVQPGVDLSEDAGPSTLAAEVVTRVLAWIAVALRFLARRLAHSKYRWDDWIIFVAAVSLLTTRQARCNSSSADQTTPRLDHHDSSHGD